MRRTAALAALLVALLSMFAASAHAQMPTGCKVFNKDHTQPSLSHVTTMFAMHLRVSVCFKAGKFTLGGRDVLDRPPGSGLRPALALRHGPLLLRLGGECSRRLLAQATATFRQCFPFVPLLESKCIGEGTLTLMLWTTANGAYVTDKRVW